MIVDVHVHPVFSGMPVHPGVERLSEAYYRRAAAAMSIEGFLAEMDRAGVERAVLLTVAWKGVAVRPRNEATAEIVARHRDRLLGFAAFDPNAGEAAVELDYAVRELGLCGAKIVAQNVEMAYDDRRLYPVYAKAQELAVPVLFHTGPSFLGTRSRYGDVLALDDVALDFPNMKIVIAHLAMHRFLDAHSLLVRHANVYADLSFWPLHPLYRDLVPWALFERTAADKLLLGSDFPVGQTPTEAVAAVAALPIGDDFKRKILGENAARLLGL